VDALSDFSNFGTQGAVELAAPGEFFVVSVATGGEPNYTYAGTSTLCAQENPLLVPHGCGGTSFAAPMVAGAAALVLAADPALTGKPCELRDRILRNASVPTTNLGSFVKGGRRLNVDAAARDVNSTPLGSCP
jgi:subtilisin family serine protease